MMQVSVRYRRKSVSSAGRPLKSRQKESFLDEKGAGAGRKGGRGVGGGGEGIDIALCNRRYSNSRVASMSRGATSFGGEFL